jgi:hypothetical protein
MNASKPTPPEPSGLSNKAITGICLAGVFVFLLVIAIPNFIKARSTPASNPCLNNLRQLDGAKDQWAVENKKSPTDIPAWEDIVGTDLYLKTKPVCPKNGTYKLNAVSQKPTCTVPGHVLE